MQHQLNLILQQRGLIHLGPGCIQQVAQGAGIAQTLPQAVRDVRCGRVQAAQQNAKAFNQRHLRTRRVGGLEVFERIDHLHRARHHGVVLHALVVVIHLFQHGVDLQPQDFRLFAEIYIF